MTFDGFKVSGLTIGFAVTIIACATGSARAQNYTIGGDARAFAMGGAGVALTQQRGTGGRTNPASLAYENKDVLPTFPSVSVRSNGPANVNVASTYLLNGTKASDATSIARQYGSSDSTFGVNGYAALRVGRFEISGAGVGVGHLYPNAALQNWVKNGNNILNNLDPTSRADFYAAGYYNLPAVAFAGTLPAKRTTTAIYGVGLRVKAMTGLYSHRIVDYNGLVGTTNGTLAPEMNGKNQLRKSGTGADLGFLVRPRSGAGFSGGLVLANIVHPSFVFESKDVAGNTVSRFDIVKASTSAGVGYQTGKGFTAAADLVNIGDKKVNDLTGGQQFRFGVEQVLFHTIAVRGGYNQVSGVTYGGSLFGLDFAFGKKVPLEVVKTINF